MKLTDENREFVHKVQLLINIFGQDAVYAAIKKKTVQKWLRGGAQTSSRSLWTLCRSLGMTTYKTGSKADSSKSNRKFAVYGKEGRKVR